MGQVCHINDPDFSARVAQIQSWQKFVEGRDLEDLKTIIPDSFNHKYTECSPGRQYILISSINEILDRELTGKGLFYRPHKLAYFGDIRNGKPEGSGTMIFKNEMIYQGKVNKSRPHGKGILYTKNKEKIQEGSWESGKLKTGLFYDLEKRIKTLQIRKDIKQKQESGLQYNILYSNGDCYIGQGDIRDKFFYRNGQGKYLYQEANVIYEGGWKENMKHGEGCMTFQQKYESFKGCFENDMKKGRGVYYYRNGSRIEGTWSDDEHYKGIYYRPEKEPLRVNENGFMNESQDNRQNQ